MGKRRDKDLLPIDLYKTETMLKVEEEDKGRRGKYLSA
jgi:hypothetical protein